MAVTLRGYSKMGNGYQETMYTRRKIMMLRFDQKGQGTTEYVVILAIIVGIAVLLFNGPFKGALQSSINDITSKITTAGK